MTRALLFAGRAIIALDLCWLIFSFAVFIHLERFNHANEVFSEYFFSFFHFATLVSMLYFTERRDEESTTDYRLLNLDWKNTPLIIIALFTDTVSLTRSIRSTAEEFYNLLLALAIFGFFITVLALGWFLLAVFLTRNGSAKRTEFETPLVRKLRK